MFHPLRAQSDAATQRKKRTFRTFKYRGIELEQLLDLSVTHRYDDLMKLLNARQRRRFNRGLKRKHMALLKKLVKAKKECPENEKPEVVRTHLRNMIVVPEMIGSVVGVYNGRTFTQVEIKVRRGRGATRRCRVHRAHAPRRPALSFSRARSRP